MLILYTFILKILDNGLSTVKTIFITKGNYFLAALFNAISTFFYLVAVVELTKSNNILAIISMCVATFLGTWWSGLLVRKTEKDKLFIFTITATSMEKGQEFADLVRQHNLAIRTAKTYNSKMVKTLNCEVFCKTKEDTKLLRSLIPDDFNYHMYVPKETDLDFN